MFFPNQDRQVLLRTKKSSVGVQPRIAVLFFSVFMQAIVVAACFSVSPVSAQNSSAKDIGFDRATVFDEVAEKVAKNFWDKSLDVKQWERTASTFRSSAISASTHDQFSRVVNELLATLKVSHTHYYSVRDPKRFQLLGVFHQLFDAEGTDLFVYEGIGMLTELIAGKHVVLAAYDGLPASEAGVRYGDQVTAVDGKPFHPIDSFSSKSGSTVSIEVLRKGQRKILQVPVETLDGRDMFHRTLEGSVAIHEKDGSKIGYVHVWSYAGSKFQELLKDQILWGKLKSCDALVLDLRDGWGGADINYLNLFRPPIANIQSTSRTGERSNYNGVWGKPVALVVNQRSTSGKELFTYGFKKLGLGKVYGGQTAGAVVGGRCFLLSNKDVLYLAAVDVNVDGTRLEGVGVKPDIMVDRSFESETDEQLEAAINGLASELEPARK